VPVGSVLYNEPERDPLFPVSESRRFLKFGSSVHKKCAPI